jgi:hypothetical protein
MLIHAEARNTEAATDSADRTLRSLTELWSQSQPGRGIHEQGWCCAVNNGN